MGRTVQEQLEKLAARKARIEKRMSQLNAAQRRAKQKADHRRHVLAGKVALDYADVNESFGKALFRLLDRSVTKPADRKLFGLSHNARGPDNAPQPERTPPLDGHIPS